MLGEKIDFDSCCEENEIIEFLYKVFQNDFIHNRCYLADKIYIDPKSDKLQNGKEEIFWHVITRKDRRTRKLDKHRASRLKWIKPIILRHAHEKIKTFYYFEDTGKIRLYLWAFEVDFVVIMQKLGSVSSYLVTSFYIDNQKKRDVFEKKFTNYVKKKDVKLKDCEWF